jgi:RNA-splicing ligase RtcB
LPSVQRPPVQSNCCNDSGRQVGAPSRSIQVARQESCALPRPERGIAEEAPGAYKDVGAVVDATERAGLARTVARLRPFICIKG